MSRPGDSARHDEPNPSHHARGGRLIRDAGGPAQQAAYSAAQGLIVDDAPAVFLYHATRVAAVSNRVQHLEMDLGSLPSDKLVHVDVTP
jgi:hypothetical protein